ncbi:cytochrome b/b6 domain-containing protein [Parasphingorhabdus sp.]|uniref:cytochrome b/b6 domain-containing protein n=1 Tax=Parasphingorhabdus sp. TaxID=2709688 RepID=UPI003A8EF61D
MADKSPRILVWDWAIRLVHWLMVILIPLLWWTAEEGYMEWHKSLGLTMFGLVLFRLLWGVIGSWTARFIPMVQRIGSLPSYIAQLRNRDHRPTFGHSPLAILSVFALLLALATQVTTGLFSVDVDGLESGPLATLISFETGRQLAEIHELNFNLLAALIGLHITAIAVYHFVLKENLVGPMVSGRRIRKELSAAQLPENRLRPVPVIAASIITLVCTLAVASFG